TIARERISAPPSTTPSHAIACWTRSRRPRQPAGVKRPVRRDRARFSACYSTTTFQEIKDEDLSSLGNCRPFFGRAGSITAAAPVLSIRGACRDRGSAEEL